MKLIMTKGLPGSGKSTWAKQMSRNNQQYVRVNKDELRAKIGYTPHREDMVCALRDSIVTNVLLVQKKNIIVDDTNFHPKHEIRLRALAELCHADFEVNFFDTPLAQCIKNDLKRAESVGKDVIMKMYKQYLAPKPLNAWSYDNSLEDVIICDLDGTLAIHVARGPYEMEKLETDKVDFEIYNLLIRESAYGRKILFVTGREDKYREATERWLKANALGTRLKEGYALHMRPTDDHREDSIIKQEIFDREIKRKFNVIYVLDDRNRVVEMWRRNGLKCLQVAEGDF